MLKLQSAYVVHVVPNTNLSKAYVNVPGIYRREDDMVNGK